MKTILSKTLETMTTTLCLWNVNNNKVIVGKQ